MAAQEAIAALNDNLAQLLQEAQQLRAQPAKKTTIKGFSSTDPVEWMEWIRQFRTVANVNNWGDQRARRELFLAMEGEARHHIQHLPLGDEGPNVAAVGELVDQYTAIFVPEGGTEAARYHLKNTSQEEEETLKQWHSRVRTAFCRAYPQMGGADVELNGDLREYFINGLRSYHLKDKLGARAYNNFTELFNEANRADSWAKQMARQYGALPEPTVKREHAINALANEKQPEESTSQNQMHYMQGRAEQRKRAPGLCYECNLPNHIARDCLARQKGARGGQQGGRSFQRSGSDRNNGWKGQGYNNNRNRGNFRGRSYRGRPRYDRNAPRVNAMEVDRNMDKASNPETDYSEAYGQAEEDQGFQ